MKTSIKSILGIALIAIMTVSLYAFNAVTNEPVMTTSSTTKTSYNSIKIKGLDIFYRGAGM